MKKVMLEDVCYSASSNISQKDVMMLEGQYPVYGASGLIKKINFYKYDREYIAIVKDGAGVGRAMILPANSSVISTMQYIFPKDNINIRFLYYALKSMNLAKYYSGVTIPHIYYKDYKKENLYLPNINEQIYIVTKLDNIRDVIDLRKKQIEELGKLVKSQFVEMFGKEIYDKKCLNDISVIKGEYGSGASAGEYIDGMPRYIRITDIKEDGGLNNTSIVSPKNENNLEKYTLSYGDILFARTGATVGKTYKYSEEDGYCIYAGYCIRFRLDLTKVNPDYIFIFTKTEEYKRWVTNKQRVVAQPNINAKEYGNDLLIPIPPIKLQNQFADIVKQIDKQKFEIQKSLEEMQKLQESLMNKYFGE